MQGANCARFCGSVRLEQPNEFVVRYTSKEETMNESMRSSSKHSKNTNLYRRFLDSSTDDSSSSGSISESTSIEVGKLMDSIKKEYPSSTVNNNESNVSSGFKTNRLLNKSSNEAKSPSTEDSMQIGMRGIDVLNNSSKKLDMQKSHNYCSPSNNQLLYIATKRLNEKKDLQIIGSIIKITAMVILWIFCTIVLIEKKEVVTKLHQISVPPNETKSYTIMDYPENNLVRIKMEGAFLPHYYANLSSRQISIWIELIERESSQINFSVQFIDERKAVTELWNLPIVSEDLIDTVPDLTQEAVLQLDNATCRNISLCKFKIRLQTNLQSSFPVAIGYDVSAIDIEYGVIYAVAVLIILYVLIIFEIVHRTLASMLAAAISVAILAALNERPTISELASWIDFETLLLLFSMMVLVAVFSETGVFDYFSVCTYQLTNGRTWPLIFTLCLLTAFLSSLVDNVTTALLMTPVTIRLSEVMELNPVMVLMVVMIFSNIGGALTPVGDPPNVIVASHPAVKAAGINFGVFVLHMSIGLFFVSLVVMIQLKIMFSRKKLMRCEDPLDMKDLKHEIAVWERAAASISSYSKDEDVVRETLMKRVRRLLSESATRVSLGQGPQQGNYTRTLEDLRTKYPIRNKPLLYKSGFALAFVIIVFFLHSIPDLHLSLGCTAFMGALLLLIISDQTHLEGVLARVEWSTLLFFASLFILMEALTRMRLIEWIGHQTETMILAVNPEFRLPVSLLIILWISAGVSSFLDNIPLTSMMIRIVVSISQNPELGLPLAPHVWALSYGACLGGIATLIGSSANVVCAGIAEQHGYRYSFVQYSRFGIPIALMSLLVISIYLMIVHVLLKWNC